MQRSHASLSASNRHHTCLILPVSSTGLPVRAILSWVRAVSVVRPVYFHLKLPVPIFFRVGEILSSSWEWGKKKIKPLVRLAYLHKLKVNRIQEWKNTALQPVPIRCGILRSAWTKKRNLWKSSSLHMHRCDFLLGFELFSSTSSSPDGQDGLWPTGTAVPNTNCLYLNNLDTASPTFSSLLISRYEARCRAVCTCDHKAHPRTKL